MNEAGVVKYLEEAYTELAGLFDDPLKEFVIDVPKKPPFYAYARTEAVTVTIDIDAEPLDRDGYDVRIKLFGPIMEERNIEEFVIGLTTWYRSPELNGARIWVYQCTGEALSGMMPEKEIRFTVFIIKEVFGLLLHRLYEGVDQ